VAVDIDAALNSVGWWASLHRDLTTIGEPEADDDRQVGDLK
jgi:hypothetical protein